MRTLTTTNSSTLFKDLEQEKKSSILSAAAHYSWVTETIQSRSVT